MKFDKAATTNPIDQLKIVGRPVTRIDGRQKVTGAATYAYEQHQAAPNAPNAPNAAYGYVVGAAIAKGRIVSIDLDEARRAPGVIAIVTAESAGKLGKGKFNTAPLLAGPEIAHYHQAIGLVVAESFEQARAAAQLVKVKYAAQAGKYDLAAARGSATPSANAPAPVNVGDFPAAFAAAPVRLDAEYTTPGHSHAMMEPYASVAAWQAIASRCGPRTR